MAFSGEIEKLERRWLENPLGLTFAPLAEAYRKAGDPARALELLEQGLAQHPNYVPAHIVRGRCHLDAESDSAAEQAFLRVAELDPENVIALKGLAELSERGGRLQEAIHRLEVLLDVDRNNEEARGQLDRVRELMATQVVPAMPVVPPAPVVAPAPEITEPAAEPVPAAAESEVEFQEPAYHDSAPPVSDAPETVVPEPARPFDEDSLVDLELEVASQLTAAPSQEFQLDNDSETLRPTDQRIADIVLGAEPQGDDAAADHAGYAAESASPDPLAESGVDSVEALGDDYASLMAYRDVSAPPPVDVPETAPGTTLFEQIAMMPEVPPADADVLPPPPSRSFEPASFLPPPPEPEPVSAMEAEPVAQAESPEPAPSAEPELAEVEPAQTPAMADGYVPLGDLGAPTPYQPAAPVRIEEPESSVAEEPELVVTETMAEIFLRQGHRELALAVYAQLAQRDPDNQRIAAALTRLAPEPAAPPTPTPKPVQPFAASETGGRSVGELFRSLLAASRPTPASAIHPPAFELPKRVTGQPTRPSQESLSLSAVFGEEHAPSGPAGAPQEGAPGEPSFDEFFAPATGSSGETELPKAPDAGAQPAQVPEDLEQFNAWLRGLKR
jgi:tetratricopeptide (TPR) repeat protein